MSRSAPVQPKPIDRRVRRTQRQLKEALLELIEARGYDAVTVEEIADHADVGRSTFYSHFDSKEDLLFSGFDEWVLSLAEGAPTEGPRRDGFSFSLPLLRHMSGHAPFLKALFLGINGGLRKRVQDLIVAVVDRELAREPRTERSRVRRKGSPDAEQERSVRAHAVAGAFLGLVTWWLADASGLTAEAVDEIFQKTVGGAR